MGTQKVGDRRGGERAEAQRRATVGAPSRPPGVGAHRVKPADAARPGERAGNGERGGRARVHDGASAECVDIGSRPKSQMVVPVLSGAKDGFPPLFSTLQPSKRWPHKKLKVAAPAATAHLCAPSACRSALWRPAKRGWREDASPGRAFCLWGLADADDCPRWQRAGRRGRGGVGGRPLSAMGRPPAARAARPSRRRGRAPPAAPLPAGYKTPPPAAAAAPLHRDYPQLPLAATLPRPPAPPTSLPSLLPPPPASPRR